MKLVGELKEKVKKTQDLIEAKELIAKAGMELSEDELEEVAGGKGETRHKQERGLCFTIWPGPALL